MIYLLIDFILSYFTKIPTFFFLLNIILIKKESYPKLLILTLVLDLLILNTYFLNTIIISCIFFLYKELKITKKNFKNYLISLILIYFSYCFIIGLLNNYSLYYIIKFIINNLLYQFIFYFVVYKIEESNIELSR